jgi:hypothetical protein
MIVVCVNESPHAVFEDVTASSRWLYRHGFVPTQEGEYWNYAPWEGPRGKATVTVVNNPNPFGFTNYGFNPRLEWEARTKENKKDA